MLEQFEEVFKVVGWENFWNVEDDEGCIALTIEFLMTLRVDTLAQGTSVYYRLFNTEYRCSAKEFSHLLGFASSCSLSDPEAFYSQGFWDEICGGDAPGKYSITKIHNPTLRFLARWVSLAVFLCATTRCVAKEDLKCLFAMCRRIRYAPVVDMLNHWLGSLNKLVPITCTSFITRIAKNLGALSTAQLEYIPGDNHVYGLDHFI
jgi:hypothetical protein